jgi:hypothetical protein
MADADTTSGILTKAGFHHISLRCCDLPITIGANIEEAVEFAMSLGPAGEILRLAGNRAAHLHHPIADALHHCFTEWIGSNGITAPASTWVVSATPTPSVKPTTIRGPRQAHRTCGRSGNAVD